MKLNDLPLMMAVKTSVVTYQAKQRLSLWLTGLLTGALASTPAHADGDLADMANSALGFFPKIKPFVMGAALPVGIIFVFLALLMIRWKKNNPNIKAWEIVTLFGVGLCLIALSQIISRGQKQLGIQPVGVS